MTQAPAAPALRPSRTVMVDLLAFVPKARFQWGVALSPDATTVAYSSNAAHQFGL